MNAVVKASDAVHTRYTSKALLTATVTVSNTGTKVADHSVLVFASPPNAGTNGTQLMGLVGFERIFALGAGASQSVEIPVTSWSLALADADGEWGTEAGAWTVSATNGTGAGSSAVHATLTVA